MQQNRIINTWYFFSIFCIPCEKPLGFLRMSRIFVVLVYKHWSSFINAWNPFFVFIFFFVLIKTTYPKLRSYQSGYQFILKWTLLGRTMFQSMKHKLKKGAWSIGGQSTSNISFQFNMPDKCLRTSQKIPFLTAWLNVGCLNTTCIKSL